MSVLPAGRSLRQFLPDLDEFLLDPAAALQAAPVEIGPRRAYGLAALFAVFGLGCLVACIVSGEWHDERLLLGIGLLVGASVWLGWSLRLRGHSLVLRPEGVEIRHLESVVWCPWALFSSGGTPVVPEGDDPRVAVIVPVSPEAVPFVELRRNESLVAQGVQVRTPYFKFAPPDMVVLAARYEVAAGELGTLLLQLGNRLGRRLPRGTPPPEAFPHRDPSAPEVAGPDAEDWYTVPIGRLHFPPRCSSCLQATNATLLMPVFAGNLAGRLTGTANRSEVAVPVCPDCQERIRTEYRRRGVGGLNAGAILGALASAGLAFVQGERTVAALAFAGLAGAAIGALLGMLIGVSATQYMPVRFRRHRPDFGTVQIRFRNSHFADLVTRESGRESKGS